MRRSNVLVPALALVLVAADEGAAAAAEGDAKDAAKAKEAYTSGLRLFAAGHTEEAMAEFRRAVKLEPKFPDPHRAMGTLLARGGDLPNMCREFAAYVKLAPHAGDRDKILREMAKYAPSVPVCRVAGLPPPPPAPPGTPPKLRQPRAA